MGVAKDSNSTRMDSAQWLKRFPQIASGTEMVTMIQEGARIMTDLMSVDELGAELQRQQAIIAALQPIDTDAALHAMFLAFGFSEADIPALIIRAQTCGDSHLVWESMEDQFGSSRVAPYRPERCDGIHLTDEVVVKRKNYTSQGRSIRNQCEIQRFAHAHLTPKNGYTLLFSPNAWNCALAPAMRHTELYYERLSNQQYEMEQIDVSDPVTADVVAEELAAFTAAAKEQHILIRDVELFRQPDGRIALISFGRCGSL